MRCTGQSAASRKVVWNRALTAAVAVLAVAWCVGPAVAGPVLFVVAERPGVAEHGDSFILPLSDSADIAHARDLILRGPEAAGAPIVFAEVAAGADGINRDVLAPDEPLWNWHVSGFEGFGDMGLELVDGWPTFVESDVPGWIANTRRSPGDDVGHIGFWNYTVVSELTPATVPVPAALASGIVGLCAVVLARRWPGAPWRRR